MFWSAVSLSYALSADQLQKKDVAVWDSVKASVAILLREGSPAGQAALISDSGLFLANQATVPDVVVEARLSSGKILHLRWVATDGPTQTVLLQAGDWQAGDGRAVRLHDPAQPLVKAPVVVVLPQGPVRGELVATNRLGIVNPSKRMFPLGEVHFEATEQSVAGALVFDESGNLVGLLNATLSASSEPSHSLQKIPVPKGFPLPPPGTRTLLAPAKMGPGSLMVGYTVGPGVLHRVVAGFVSPEHQVQHPAIGVFCKDAPGMGALVQQVKADSPAEKAGLKAGDVIIKMDGAVIQNQFDFARAIEAKDVGDGLTVVVVRDGMAKTLKVTVGAVVIGAS